jgi:hypothetical protein
VFVAAVAASRRWRVALLAISAFVVAAALAVVAARLAIGHWPDIGRAIVGGSGSPAFPVVRVAEAGAVVLTVGAQLVRRLELVGHWLLGLGLGGGLVLHPAAPSGSVAAILVTIAAAAAVRLAFKTSLGRPGVEDVAAALRELGVGVTTLQTSRRQVAGVFELEAADEDGRPLVVKAYGRNAYDNRLLATMWRAIWYHSGGPAPGLSRVQAVVQEAFATLLATRAGVPALEVVEAGTTVRGDAVLVLRGAVRPLAELAAGELEDVQPASFWRALSVLQDVPIAHREVSPSTLALVGGEAGLIDFGAAVVTPTHEQLLADSAQLLASTAAVFGSDRASRRPSRRLATRASRRCFPTWSRPPSQHRFGAR